MTKNECIQWVEAHLEVRYAKNNGAYKSGRKINPQGCVNHSLGVAQPSADIVFDQMNRSSVQWGVNAILGDFHKGDGKIILAMPLDTRPWGCGKGRNGSWNNTKVQWEVCEPAGHTYNGGTMIGYDVAKNQVYFDRMWKMLVAWNVYVADKFGYSIEGISDHAESHRAGYGSNHADISHWIPKHGKNMDMLRQEVADILAGRVVPDIPLNPVIPQPQPVVPDTDTDTVTDHEVERFHQLWLAMRQDLQDNDASEWSKEGRDWCVQKGIIQGGSAGTFNGMWEDVLTREQMCTMLYRFAKAVGLA